MTIFVISIGIFDLVLKLAVKLPADVIHQRDASAGLIKSPLFFIVYNAILIAGFLTIFLTRKETRYYPIRVIAFGMLLAGLIGQLLVTLAPWRN
jgi:hypothetical protein